MSTTIRTNCPRDCYDGCGVLVELRPGENPRVLGDPDHPVSRGRLCTKCAVAYNGVWQDDSARLSSPLRRVGPKGSGEFQPCSWDEALETIAERLNGIIASDGADAILHTHYSGTLSLIAFLFPNRFFLHLGASEVDPDSICNAAGHVAWHLLYGNSAMGFDPRTAKDSNCILVWGANPSHSAPHAHEHWLTEAPGRVIVVDPVRTETAAQADLHLQPRPGSDSALAFGLLNALRAQGAFDQDFIAERTLGFDEITADIDACTPEWAEEQTGVPAAKIRHAAEWYGAGPSLLWCGQGLQRQPQGGNIMRTVGLLPALTGNVGKPGAGFYYLNYTPAFANIDLDALAGAQLATREPKKVSHMELAPRLAAPDEFKALFVWNTNPLASAPDQTALRRAFEREDLFTVVVDCFETDSARYADIVLPAASFMEFDDLTWSYFHLYVGAQTKFRDPPGDALPNSEIFRRIARAMALDDVQLYETDEVLIESMLAATGTGLDFDALKAQGHFYLRDDPVVFYEDLEFETPSKKIEIASAAAEEMGLPRCPRPTVDPAPASGHLRLLTPASKWRLNDSYANDPHLVAQAGPATLLLNPADAAELGITDGATVEITNDSGTLRLEAEVSDRVLPGTALSYKGRWPSLEGGHANVNFVHTARMADMAESTSVHGTEVRVRAIG